MAFVPGFGALGGSVLLAGVVFAVLGIITMVAGLGLWNLRRWALILAIIILVAEIVLAFYPPGINVCTLIISIVLLIYLLLIRSEFH